MMDTLKIINRAAKFAGKPLPLDDYDRKFGEGLSRSLSDTMDWVHGKKPVPKSANIHASLAKWQAMADALPEEAAPGE